jgi:hypothetical protein
LPLLSNLGGEKVLAVQDIGSRIGLLRSGRLCLGRVVKHGIFRDSILKIIDRPGVPRYFIGGVKNHPSADGE